MTSVAVSPETSPERAAPDRAGLIAGLICYTVWGFLPILFAAAERSGAGAYEIVAWRSLWSIPLAILFVMAADRGASLKDLWLRPRILLALLFSATLIVCNWTVYVWAVVHGHVLAASLGYYINPLLNMAAGAVLFRERISRTGYAAIGLAATGVLIQGVALQGPPWIPLMLAFTFCGYGVVRKSAAVSAQTGLLVECLYLAIPAVAYIGWLAASGHGAFGRSAAPTLLLALCGPATVVPLVLFTFTARRLPLTLIGFIQFIAPTLQFCCGLAAGETLTPLTMLSFVFIWAGVLVFAAGAIIQGRRRRSGSA
jgi:chloramphenicol-sensitive protein RarD